MTSTTNPPGPWTPPAGLCALALALVTVLVYARTFGHGFVGYDDTEYLTENAMVARGLTLEGLAWAFGFHAGNWHPLTWLSHMLDVELFGLRGGPHHAVSVGLHALNAVLFFLAFDRLGRARWSALLAATLFALHPLRVESVAWASERKDVLAGTFFFLTLWCYGGYVRRGGAWRYAGTALALALGLMAKPMLVTVPFLLLVLDAWPLDRLQGRRPWLEKLPLLLLVFASAVVTLIVQRAAGAVGSLGSLTLAERVANAGASYVTYLGQAVWPVKLACFYPHPALVADDLRRELFQPGFLALGLVLVLTVVLVRWRRELPELITGWLWYLGTALPVIGLVQVGQQAHADRYTYLPLCGIALALAFGLARLVRWRPRLRPYWVTVALAVLAHLALATRRQVVVWEDTRSLFEHALSVTERNYLALGTLGVLERRSGHAGAALPLLEQALEYEPRYVDAMYELGLAQLDLDQPAEARRLFKRTLRNDPRHVGAHRSLGIVELRLGLPAEAVTTLRTALALEPRSRLTRLNLALALGAAGESEEALEHLRALVGERPQDPDARAELVRLLLEARRLDEAETVLEGLPPTQREDPRWRSTRRRLERLRENP